MHSVGEAGQDLIGGMGELHLEVVLDRLKREHGLEVELVRMQVAYRESITEEATSQVRGVKQKFARASYDSLT